MERQATPGLADDLLLERSACDICGFPRYTVCVLPPVCLVIAAATHRRCASTSPGAAIIGVSQLPPLNAMCHRHRHRRRCAETPCAIPSPVCLNTARRPAAGGVLQNTPCAAAVDRRPAGRSAVGRRGGWRKKGVDHFRSDLEARRRGATVHQAE